LPGLIAASVGIVILVTLNGETMQGHEQRRRPL
jgi:hypothetical protein